MHSEGNSKKVLGKVIAPCGTVMLIDFGLMDLWTHDQPPLVPSGVLNDEALKSANSGSDFTIEGPDALKAGKKFDRQPNPLFLYDIPSHNVEELKESFDMMVQREGLDARLVELPSRVCPIDRTQQTITQNGGAGEVFLHGIHAIAVSGIPTGQELNVVGHYVGEGEYAKHWRDISLVISESSPVAESNKIGHVAVDMARLMFCDLDSMGKWTHQDTIDGLADFVFWGKDAARLAKKFAAEHLEGNVYGFVDKPINEMAGLAMQVHRHVDQHHLVAAADFRPHSDHWRMLKAVAEKETESGEIELGNSRCCGFMTSWGDGFFPVYLDRDTNGSPLRIRIDLGTEETIKGMHMVNRFA